MRNGVECLRKSLQDNTRNGVNVMERGIVNHCTSETGLKPRGRGATGTCKGASKRRFSDLSRAPRAGRFGLSYVAHPQSEFGANSRSRRRAFSKTTASLPASRNSQLKAEPNMAQRKSSRLQTSIVRRGNRFFDRFDDELFRDPEVFDDGSALTVKEIKRRLRELGIPFHPPAHEGRGRPTP